MTVISLDGNSTVYPPANLTLLAPDPGYTCGPVVETTPTVSSDLGRQKTSSGLHSEVDSLPLSDVEKADTVQCTDHICPGRVHWHVKNNYMDRWRVKMTISNYNYKKNYSDS
ncbi:hypothetical protein OIU77_020915 [Salix suchowensis]|uniref:COBRA C-terminal domain-containing protein n=1 Tax=Salix suchowensis TaxID=1278906 RepID=A0ABQ9C811_9ROSI|nr:hypothetical protein OIU77_020915 [Salix suchowensis]